MARFFPCEQLKVFDTYRISRVKFGSIYNSQQKEKLMSFLCLEILGAKQKCHLIVLNYMPLNILLGIVFLHLCMHRIAMSVCSLLTEGESRLRVLHSTLINYT